MHICNINQCKLESNIHVSDNIGYYFLMQIYFKILSANNQVRFHCWEPGPNIP
jgi:hypothetical protein